MDNWVFLYINMNISTRHTHLLNSISKCTQVWSWAMESTAGEQGAVEGEQTGSKGRSAS